jgi:hypothetical protein
MLTWRGTDLRFQPRILNEFALRNVSAHACVSQVYAPQTKILEGGTKDEIRIFDLLTFQWFVAQIEYSRT